MWENLHPLIKWLIILAFTDAAVLIAVVVGLVGAVVWLLYKTAKYYGRL